MRRLVHPCTVAACDVARMRSSPGARALLLVRERIHDETNKNRTNKNRIDCRDRDGAHCVGVAA